MKLYRALIYLSIVFAAPLAAAESSNTYFFDAGWRTSAGVNAALDRIESIVGADADAKVEVLVHGSDIRLFARKKSNKNPYIVERGKQLSVDGRVAFKVCEHALEFKSLELEDLPAYFGTVHYVPEHIQTLRRRGYRAVSFSGAQTE